MGNPKSGIHLQYVDFKRIFPFSCRRSKRAAPNWIAIQVNDSDIGA